MTQNNTRMIQTVHRDAIDRIIGMNESIAMTGYDTDRYSDARVVSYVVRGV